MRRPLLLLLAILPLYGQDPGFDGYLRVLRMAPGISIESRVKALDESGILLNGNGLRGWERWSAAPASVVRAPGLPERARQDANPMNLPVPCRRARSHPTIEPARSLQR